MPELSVARQSVSHRQETREALAGCKAQMVPLAGRCLSAGAAVGSAEPPASTSALPRHPGCRPETWAGPAGDTPILYRLLRGRVRTNTVSPEPAPQLAM